jgi:hypothetical protein
MNDKPTVLRAILRWKGWDWNLPAETRYQRAKTIARWNGSMLAVGSVFLLLIAIGKPNQSILDRLAMFGCFLFWLVSGIAGVIWGRRP